MMAKRSGFSLQAAGTVDLGSLRDIQAFTTFMDAWTGKAADIPILGAAGTALREQHLRLRAEVILPTVRPLGAGADSIAAIVSTAKHLARPAQVGEARMFGAAFVDEQRLHLVPQDASCVVCGSEDITLEPTRHGTPATVFVRGLDGMRKATPYKKVCSECGTVHNFNEVKVPAGRRPRWELPAAAALEGASAEPLPKRRCFRPDVLKQRYFRATGKTWYTREYMEWTTTLLESVQVSFDGMTRATRAVRRDEGLLDRVDRENLLRPRGLPARRLRRVKRRDCPCPRRMSWASRHASCPAASARRSGRFANSQASTGATSAASTCRGTCTAARPLAAAAPPRSMASTTSTRSSVALRCGTTSGSGGGTRSRSGA